MRAPIAKVGQSALGAASRTKLLQTGQKNALSLTARAGNGIAGGHQAAAQRQDPSTLLKMLSRSLSTKAGGAGGEKGPMLVNSGVGGAMAGNLIKGDITEFGHTQCLPIGEKDVPRKVTYTAGMALYALVQKGASDAIVACNTASVLKKEACVVMAKFISEQAADLDKGMSIFPPGSEEAKNIKSLAAEMVQERSLDDPRGTKAIAKKVHEIVTPTAKLAAEHALDALLGRGDTKEQDQYFIVIDSTDGTCTSNEYPKQISQIVGKALAKDYTFPKDEATGSPQSSGARYASTKNTNVEPMFSPQQLHLPEGSNTHTSVFAHVFEFAPSSGGKDGEEEKRSKTLLISGRGDNAWVPAIEGNKLGEPLLEKDGKTPSKSGLTVGQALAKMARHDAAALVQKTVASDHAEKFKPAPDLSMMCCTHYPAMAEMLEEEMVKDPTADMQDRKPNILTQDVVVADIFEGLKKTQANDRSKIAITEEMPADTPTKGGFQTTVELGLAAIDDETKNDKHAVLDTVAKSSGGLAASRTFAVKAISEGFQDFMSTDKAMEHRRAFDESSLRDEREEGEDAKPGDGLSSRFTEGAKGLADPVFNDAFKGLLLWELDKSNPDPAKRGNSVLKGALQNPSPITGRLADNLVRTTERIQSRLDGSDTKGSDAVVADMDHRIGRLGSIMPLGETRGVDVLAATQKPDKELLNAAVSIADRVLTNQKLVADGEPAKPVGIVTGFTVINDKHESLGGENDGPPGAMAMAKFMVDNGTPVTLVVDSGSESSAFAAAKAIGMVERDRNPIYLGAKKEGFANSVLREGFSVQVVSHGPGAKPAHSSLDDVRGKLEAQGTDLLVSIERPGPSDDKGTLSNMGGKPITKFNADLSPLFEGKEGDGRQWETIGIGDGGNEIGTGGVASLTRSLRKPDGTQVVNKGDAVAAKTETDHMVLASASNNGGLGLAIAADVALRSLGGDTTVPLEEAVDKHIETYKGVIDGLYKRGISTDGVSKVNAQTVDGRALHRPVGSDPVPVGTPNATHDDMFDLMKRAVLSTEGDLRGDVMSEQTQLFDKMRQSDMEHEAKRSAEKAESTKRMAEDARRI